MELKGYRVSCYFLFFAIQTGFTVANENIFVFLGTKVLQDMSFIRGYNRWGNNGDNPRLQAGRNSNDECQMSDLFRKGSSEIP